MVIQETFVSGILQFVKQTHSMTRFASFADQKCTHLIFGHGPVHAPVGDPERVAGELLLRVEELVEEADLLHEVSADRAHQVVEVVGAVPVRLRDPEADVVGTLRELAECLEYYLAIWTSSFKLREET